MTGLPRTVKYSARQSPRLQLLSLAPSRVYDRLDHRNIRDGGASPGFATVSLPTGRALRIRVRDPDIVGVVAAAELAEHPEGVLAELADTEGMSGTPPPRWSRRPAPLRRPQSGPPRRPGSQVEGWAQTLTATVVRRTPFRPAFATIVLVLRLQEMGRHARD